MIKMKSKTWLDTKAVRKAVNEATVEPLEKCAILVEREAKTGMRKGGRTKVAGKTTYRPSPPGNPPHSQTGRLRSSIRYAKGTGNVFYIGPTKLAWYGRVHEFGATIKVTRKMRAFLAANFGWHLKPSTTTIHIPKRPFIRPALFRAVQKFPEQFKGLKLRDTQSGRSLDARGM